MAVVSSDGLESGRDPDRAVRSAAHRPMRWGLAELAWNRKTASTAFTVEGHRRSRRCGHSDRVNDVTTHDQAAVGAAAVIACRIDVAT
jgi:hypothetical protein